MTSSKPTPQPTLDYWVLVTLLVLGLTSFLALPHQPAAQFWTILLTAVGYVCWGIWHHQRQQNLYWQVVVEYALIAGLMVALVISLLWP